MKNKKALLPVIGLIMLITLIIVEFTEFTSSKEYNIKVITEKGSYGETFVKKYNLETEILSDSNKKDYTLNIENFDFNTINGTIEIVGYKGISETIVIPNSINNIKVTKISKDAFKEAKKLKKIIIGYNELELVKEDLKDIEIVCRNSEYCNSLHNDETLKVTVLNDSDPYDYSYIQMPFEYNMNGDEIELTKYTGDENILVIPETYNGYKITKVSLDILNNDFNLIIIPNTVKEINGPKTLNLSTILLVGIITNILAYIIFLVVNFTLSRKTKEDTFLSTPTIILSVIYLIGTFAYSFIANTEDSSIKTYLLINLIITVIYIIVVILLNRSTNYIKTNNEELKEKKEFKKNALLKIDDVISSSKSEYKKSLEKIKEQIKYSDPISSVHTSEIENEILTILDKLTTEVDTKTIEELEKLINKRNNICKSNKD